MFSLCFLNPDLATEFFSDRKLTEFPSWFLFIHCSESMQFLTSYRVVRLSGPLCPGVCSQLFIPPCVLAALPLNTLNLPHLVCSKASLSTTRNTHFSLIFHQILTNLAPKLITQCVNRCFWVLI